jgi:hypothetical protein
MYEFLTQSRPLLRILRPRHWYVHVRHIHAKNNQTALRAVNLLATIR